MEQDAVISCKSSSCTLALQRNLASMRSLTCSMALQHIYMMDSKGLITTTRGDKLPSHKQAMAHGDDIPNMKEMKEVIKHVKPHALIGLTGGGPAWHKVCFLPTSLHCVP